MREKCVKKVRENGVYMKFVLYRLGNRKLKKGCMKM
jgi:hypothetical protein